MLSVTVDYDANAASILLREGRSAQTRRVGPSLLADYDDAGRLISIEVLSLRALSAPEVIAQLKELIGRDPTPAGVPERRAAAANGVTLNHVPDVVDIFVTQTDTHLAKASA